MAKAKVIITAENNMKTPLKQAQTDLTGFEKVAQKVGDTLKTAFTVTAIVAGLKALSAAINECVDSFKNQIEIDTRLQQSIKATGQQYKYSALEIKEFATNLQDVTRFGDDAVEQVAALLVSTQKFSKEGLERTITLSADLAEAMGTDLSSAAQTLEKALIEPGEGLTRLRTIGISFTDAEKEMIEELKTAGEEFKAQQIILDKVEAAYGGMAESVGSIDTSTLDKIKNVWGDIKEDLGSLFTTTLGPIFNWIYQTLRWLERLMSQTIEKGNLNKFLANRDVQGLANNFTPDYLQKEISNREGAYNKQVEYLKDAFANTWQNIWVEFELTFDEFLEKDRDTQKALLMDLYSDNPMRALTVLNELDFNDEVKLLKEAIEVINNDVLEAEQFAAEKAAKEAAAAAAREAVQELKPFLPNGTGNAFSQGVYSTMMKGWTGTVGPSPYMNTMFGQLGLSTQTLDSFMIATNEWTEWVMDLGKSNPTADFRLNGGFADFGLFNTGMDYTDTMSILGPGNIPGRGPQTGLQDKDTVVTKETQQKEAFFGNTLESLGDKMGKTGEVAGKLTTNMATMGPLLGAIATALEYVFEGLSEVLGPALDAVTDTVILPLISIGKALGSLILPIIEMTTPILTFFAQVVIGVAAVFEWVGQLLRHWAAGFVNAFSWLTGYSMNDPGAPGNIVDFVGSRIDAFGQSISGTAAGTDSVSTGTAVSSASYRGATSVTINIYANGPIVGDGGMREFARMVRDEFDALDYYGVSA